MNSDLAWFALLAVFSGLSMNLILQCGLGMRGIALVKPGRERLPPIPFLVFFITVLLLWIIFSFVLSTVSLGFFEYILVFPAASLVFFGIEFLLRRFVIKKKNDDEDAVQFCDGLAGAALFITLYIAGKFIEALALVLGFTLGMLLSFSIIGEIRRRSAMEAVFRPLRGSPLALISMGLLSLVFGSAAFMFFRALGG
jgi:electron transport complex protein RnfA